MNEQTQESVPPPVAPADQLRFSCPGCRLELSAPLSVAGVTAPCPGCGASITAPSAPAPVTEPPGQVPAPQPPNTAAPPEPRAPQASPAPVRETVQEPAPDEWAYDEGAAPDLPIQRVVRRRRKRTAPLVQPDSSMSVEEKRELRILIKLILSVLATAAITWAVCKLVSNSIMKGPPPIDSRPFVRR